MISKSDEFMEQKREIESMIKAYEAPPWGEKQTYESAKEFVESIDKDPDGFKEVYRQDPNDPPYLYMHAINYGRDIDRMIDEEFLGSGAYWKAKDPEVILQLLRHYKTAVYINNLHADKSVKIDSAHKPRLKVLPDILNTIFDTYKPEATVLFTHRSTGVYGAIESLDSKLFEVATTQYIAVCNRVEFNSNSAIDYLTLVTITR